MIEKSETVGEAEPLVEVRRGALIESRHRGHVVAVDATGKVVAYNGAPEIVTYLRSSAKPHQALPLVLSGAADHFDFSEGEIAVACGSHNGETIHIEVVRRMLEKIGLEPDALKCGVHEPFSRDVARDLRERGEPPSVLHNNCSGKHAAMLALARHLNARTETYDHPDNPVQRAIAVVVAQFSGVSLQELVLATDGCGVPVFGVPLQSMALMYARLVAPPASFNDATQAASKRIIQAMLKHPEMVGGTTDRLDTELMRRAKGQLISKVGAEGVYTAGVLPSAQWPYGLGLAIKIEDGEDRRARPTVVVETLRQLNVLDAEALIALARYATFTVHNLRGDNVGQVKPEFTLRTV